MDYLELVQYTLLNLSTSEFKDCYIATSHAPWQSLQKIHTTLFVEAVHHCNVVCLD